MQKKKMLLFIFETIEDGHFIEVFFVKMLTFQHFIFIHLMIFNIFFSF